MGFYHTVIVSNIVVAGMIDCYIVVVGDNIV